MKQKKIGWFLLMLVLTGCQSTENKGTSDSDTTLTKKDLAYKIDTSKQVNTLLVERDTVLTVDLKNNKASVRAYLSGIGRHVTFIVPVGSGDSIKAELIPDDDTANIIFKQVFIPVGKTGKYVGPFTRKIIYPVSVKGNYKLIVGESLVKESDWKGSFTCNISVK